MPLPLLTRRTCLAHALGLSSSGALGLLAGHAGAATTAADRRTVTINLTLEPDSLDPTMAASASVGEVVHYNVLEGLTKIEEDGRVVPLLAQSWHIAPDQRSGTFRLRQDVRFHDGSPLDAPTVRWSFERARAPASTNKARKSLFDNITHIETPDAHTLVLHLQHPDPHLLFRLGENTAVILHPASAAQAATQPVGTGPYRLEHWQRGHSIRLVQAATWRSPQTLHMRRATFRFFYGKRATEAAREGEGVDVSFHYASAHLRDLMADNQFQLLMGMTSGKGMLALNHRRTPLHDVRVRRAITHAIDREGFIQKALNGRATAIGSHFSPSDAGYVHLANFYPYDPQQARTLLAQASLPTPLRLKLALPPPAYARLGGDFIVAALAEVGIEVQLENMEWGQWLQGPFQGDFDLTLINHVEPLDYAIYADPQYYFGYDSAAFRHLVRQHAHAAQGRERLRLFAQMQRHLAEDAVNAWLFAPQVDTAVRKGLRGVWTHYPIFAHDISAMRWT